MSAQQLFAVSARQVKLLWKLAFVRLMVYMYITVAGAFSAMTYNVAWSKMDSDQRLNTFLALSGIAGGILLSFLDSSMKTIESGSLLPPELPQIPSKTVTETAVQQKITETTVTDPPKT